jgi:hypothetical protein
MSYLPLSGSSKAIRANARMTNPIRAQNWNAALQPNQSMMAILSGASGPPN